MATNKISINNILGTSLTKIRIAGIASTSLIFLFDLFVSANFHIEFLYSVIVLLTIWLPGKRITFDTGMVMTGLVVLGYFISFYHNHTQVEIPGRAIAVITIWVSAYAILRYKESEEGMVVSRERLDAMFEYATEGILVSNPKGIIVMINPRAVEQFGYKREELIGATIEKLVPQRFSHKHVHHRKDFFGHPRPREMGKGMTLYARRKDESEFPVEISLSFFKLKEETFAISFIIDITERKKQDELLAKSKEQLEERVKERTQELAEVNQNLKEEMDERTKIEEALRDSERLYSTIARNFPDGIICVLNKGLEYIFVDGKELRELGLTKDDFAGKTIHHVFFTKHGEEIAERFNKVFSWQSVSFEVTFRTREYVVNAVPLPDTRGIIREILVVIQNIAEQKKAEKEVRMALQKEKELNELKSKFVSTASHEFRTPLSTILSSVSLVERYTKPEEAEKRLKHVERIKSSVKNLTDILNDFLSLEKLEAGKVEIHFTEFDLVKFSEDIVEDMQSLARNGQKIIHKHSGTTEAVLDKQLLRNVLINLLNNAIKYSGENKTIELISETSNNEIIITIKDEGIGIPQEDQQHLFERFFRAQNVTGEQGTGLGLNIVRRYVKLMQGEISFASEVNVGSEFTIRFPKEIVFQQDL